MKYKRFFIEIDGHHLQKEFEEFTSRKDIIIHQIDTVAAPQVTQSVVYYDTVDSDIWIHNEWRPLTRMNRVIHPDKKSEELK